MTAAPGLQVRSKQMLEAPRNGVAATQVLVPLDGAPAFAGLQYRSVSIPLPLFLNRAPESIC
jgi:hypothetical protein